MDDRRDLRRDRGLRWRKQPALCLHVAYSSRCPVACRGQVQVKHQGPEQLQGRFRTEPELFRAAEAGMAEPGSLLLQHGAPAAAECYHRRLPSRPAALRGSPVLDSAVRVLCDKCSSALVRAGARRPCGAHKSCSRQSSQHKQTARHTTCRAVSSVTQVPSGERLRSMQHTSMHPHACRTHCVRAEYQPGAQLLDWTVESVLGRGNTGICLQVHEQELARCATPSQLSPHMRLCRQRPQMVSA